MNNKTDDLLIKITGYVLETEIKSDEAYRIAYYNLLDAIGCGIFALQFPACTKLLGPVVPE